MSGWVLTGQKGRIRGQYVLINMTDIWMGIDLSVWMERWATSSLWWMDWWMSWRKIRDGWCWLISGDEKVGRVLIMTDVYWLNSGNRDWGGRRPHYGGWVLIGQCWWAGGQHPHYDWWVDEYWLNNGDGDWGSILIVDGWMDVSRMGSDWSASGGTN